MQQDLPTNAGARTPQVSYQGPFLIAGLIVLASMFAMERSSASPWVQDPTSTRHRYTYAYDNQIRSRVPPHLVVFGSSRAAFGVEVRTIARESGFDPDSALNLAFPGLMGDSFLEQVKAHYPELTSAPLWVIGVDDYFLLGAKKSWSGSGQGSALLQRAESRVEPLFKPGIDINAKGRQLHFNLLADWGWIVKPSIKVWTMTQKGSWNDSDTQERVVDRTRDAARFARVVDGYFKDQEVAPNLVPTYEQLFAIARRHRIRVVVLDLPYHPLYRAMVQKQYADLANANRDLFRKLAVRYGAQFLSCGSHQTNCGTEESDFGDSVHLNARGSRAFSRFLVGVLQQKE